MIHGTSVAGARGELRRGWRLLVAAGLGVALSSIVLPFYSMGALVQPLTAAFGWSREEVTRALAFSAGLGALTAPLVGWWIDRHGPRALAMLGLIGLGAGMMLAATVQGSLAGFYLAYAAMALLGAGTLPATWTRAVATGFDRQRGLALGIVLAATGVCGMLVPHYVTWLATHHGWRAAYLGLGALPIVLALPVVWLWFRAPGPQATGVAGEAPANAAAAPPARALPADRTLREAARGRHFWLLIVSTLAVYAAVSGVGPNLIPALTDDGYTREQAAYAQSLFAFAIIVGRLVIGALVDRYWAPGVAAVALGLPVLGCAILAGDPLWWQIAFAVFLLGFAAGAELDLMAFLTARYFGLAHYATIYAFLYAALAIAGGIAPGLFARVHDRTASYHEAFVVSGVLFTLGAALMLALGRYPPEKTA